MCKKGRWATLRNPNDVMDRLINRKGDINYGI